MSVTRVVVLDSMTVDLFLDGPAAFALAVSATANRRPRMLAAHVTADEVARIQLGAGAGAGAHRG